MIFTGKAGGFMAEFAKLIGHVHGFDYVPIKFGLADDILVIGVFAGFFAPYPSSTPITKKSSASPNLTEDMIKIHEHVLLTLQILP